MYTSFADFFIICGSIVFSLTATRTRISSGTWAFRFSITFNLLQMMALISCCSLWFCRCWPIRTASWFSNKSSRYARIINHTPQTTFLTISSLQFLNSSSVMYIRLPDVWNEAFISSPFHFLIVQIDTFPFRTCSIFIRHRPHFVFTFRFRSQADISLPAFVEQKKCHHAPDGVASKITAAIVTPRFVITHKFHYPPALTFLVRVLPQLSRKRKTGRVRDSFELVIGWYMSGNVAIALTLGLGSQTVINRTVFHHGGVI